MARCIQLAKNGLGTTYPNPMVGSVIVVDNTILAEGWHHRAGQPHAEVNALNKIKDPSLLKNATLYVSLEPCSHFGRTPPCADRIIQSGIRKVVIGSTDPNPKVAGRGIKRLSEAGCQVTVGVLEVECDTLNKRFFTFHRKKRPYIFLKWARTADGFIAPRPETRTQPAPVWISNNQSRHWVHQLRTTEAAILVGTNTALQDNPTLTSRDWFGNHPLRVVIDRKGSIPKEATVFNKDAKTLLFTERNRSPQSWVETECFDFSENSIDKMCAILYQREIQSMVVEGGSLTLSRFIEANCWDEAYVITGAVAFGAGTPAPVCTGALENTLYIGNDVVHHYKNDRP